MAAHTADMAFRELVRSERKRLGLTQVQLAARVGVTQATVSNWENEDPVKATTPNPPEAAKLAILFGFDPIQMICRIWPEVGALDRLAKLRVTLADATTDELDALDQVARQMIDARTEPPKRRRRR